MQFGIHPGPVVAGVIGRRKFNYDLWGDTVNTTARMESHGIPDAIQVTEDGYDTLCNRYSLTPRGPVQIRGKGEMTTYLLEGRLATAG
jgi:class 3 adenylate cyclase